MRFVWSALVLARVLSLVSSRVTARRRLAQLTALWAHTWQMVKFLKEGEGRRVLTAYSVLDFLSPAKVLHRVRVSGSGCQGVRVRVVHSLLPDTCSSVPAPSVTCRVQGAGTAWCVL